MENASRASGEPSRWVRRWTHLVAPGGPVLDLACGTGRHARWFAAAGHAVLALDRDPQALAALHGVARVRTMAADLEQGAWPLPPGQRFAAVVVTNYLHRPLWPHLLQALAPAGVLLYETFAHGNASVGKPSNPAFLLQPGELLDAVRGALRVVAFQDGFLSTPYPAYIQRICAVLETGGNDVVPARYDLAG
jgi:SAM-dependent methyltransferase